MNFQTASKATSVKPSAAGALKYRAKNKLRKMNLTLRPTEADHFCFYNALLAAMKELRTKIPTIYDSPTTGFELFQTLGLDLKDDLPDEIKEPFKLFKNKLSAINKAIPQSKRILRHFSDQEKQQLWGTDAIVQYLIAPMMDNPIMVIAPSPDNSENLLSFTVYCRNKSLQDQNNPLALPQDKVSPFLKKHPDTIVLFNSDDHWQQVTSFKQ